MRNNRGTHYERRKVLNKSGKWCWYGLLFAAGVFGAYLIEWVVR